jgi:hypothetical protein
MRAMVKLLACVTLLVSAVAGCGLAQAADIANTKACAEWGDLKVIRGYCPEEYVRQDVLDATAHAAKDFASQTLFPLKLRREAFEFTAQIRHDEEPLRSRKWRGEFLIVIDEAAELKATLTRAKRPLWPQVHALVHEKHYQVIAEAFEKSMLSPSDEAWADEVKRLLPDTSAVVRDIEIETGSTDGKACPALAQRMKLLVGLKPEAVIERKSDMISIAVHPETYEVVVANYPRALYTTDTDPKSAFFKWAEGTVQALEPCWRPGKQ